MADKPDLIRPTLQTLRTHKVGKFYDRSQPKGITPIKSLTLPKWMKKGQPKKFSIDEHVVELLRNDGTKSTRHRTERPKWVPKRNGKGGYFLCHVRTPDGKTQWVSGKLAKERFNRRAGRKESGMAYKIRREFWRVLARPEDDRRLLEDDTVWKKSKKERICEEVSCGVVDLSLALGEYLSVALFKNGIIVNRNFALMWFRELKSLFEQGLDDEEAIGWIQLHPDQYMATICENRWGAILSRLIETAVLQRINRSSNDRQTMSGAELSSANLEIFQVQGDECEECGEYDWVYDSSKGEMACGKCGLVTDDIEMDGHEHHFFQTKQGSD